MKIKPIFITIDPLRDMPDQLRAYLKGCFNLIHTGPITAVRQIAQEYHVYFKKVDKGQDYLVESLNNMYLLDPNMVVMKTCEVEYDASQLSEAIVREVKKVSKL